jgi:hypothetical protein
MSGPRRRYGASGVHLAAHLTAFAIAAYALAQALGGRGARDVVVWLVAGALLHDLVLVPAYSAADWATRRVVRGRVPAINHVRVPAVISGVLLLVYFPLVLSRAPGNIERATGHRPADYGLRWLIVTAVLFAASGLLYAARVRAAGARARRRPGPRRPPGPCAPRR